MIASANSQGNQNNFFINVEDKNIRLMKSIPVTPFKQLFIKAAIPFILSSVSLLLTTIVLWATRIVSFRTACFGFLLTLILLLVFDIVVQQES